MPRHKFPFAKVVPIALLVAAAIGAAWYFLARDEGDFRTTPELDLAVYASASNSLRGNVYKFEGEVFDAIGWSPTQGRLIAVSTGQGSLVPVLVTTAFNSTNIQKGQRYLFQVEVDDRGILRTKNLSKS